MTNVELIKELQKSVDKYGELSISVSDDCSGGIVSDILCDGKTVVIYDF